MAKRKTEEKTTSASEFTYGVQEVADATGLQPASVRVGLRDSDFTKEGKSWGWNKKGDFDAVVKYFKERGDRKPAMGKTDAKVEKPKRAAGKKKEAAAAPKPRRKKAS